MWTETACYLGRIGRSGLSGWPAQSFGVILDTLWWCSILARCACAFRFTGRFRVWLAFTVACSLLLWAVHLSPAGWLYDWLWRGCALLEMAWLAGLVIHAAAGADSAFTARAVLLTAIFTILQSHADVWPGYWLDWTFRLLCWGYCLTGLIVLSQYPAERRAGSSGPLGVSRGLQNHSDFSLRFHLLILSSYCLLTAVLYSGAALSISSVGIALELLDVMAFTALWVARQCDSHSAS